MNNGFIETPSSPEQLEARETRMGVLVNIIEALSKISASEEWSTLKKEVFSGALESLEGRLVFESKKPELDLPEIYRLQGQIQSTKKYDFEHLTAQYRLELQRLKEQP